MAKFLKKHLITVGFSDTVTFDYCSKTIKTENSVEVELEEGDKLSDIYSQLKKTIGAIHKKEVQTAFDELREEVSLRKAIEEKEKKEREEKLLKEKEAKRLPVNKEEAMRVMFVSENGEEISVNDFINNSPFPKVETLLETSKEANPRVHRALLILLNKPFETNTVTKTCTNQNYSTLEGDSEVEKAKNYPTPSFCKQRNPGKKILGNCNVRELTFISTANKSTDLEKSYAKLLLKSQNVAN